MGSDLSDSESDNDIEVGNVDSISAPEIQVIAQLVASLEANPYQYESHLKLIELFKKAMMLEELREAREAMNRVYPLSETIWKEWIEDESRIATAEDEKQYVTKLFERATSEYHSVDLWIMFVEYVVEQYQESVENKEPSEFFTKVFIFQILAKAELATRWDIPRSNEVWNIIEKFEVQHLSSDDAPEVARVKSRFLDRIKISTADNSELMSSYSSFVTKHYPDNYEKNMVHSNSLKADMTNNYRPRKRFEEMLVTLEKSLEAFTAYLEFEKKAKPFSPAQLETLFERAISVHCLVPSLWGSYLQEAAGPRLSLLSPRVLSIAERAVRNCPWSGDLWTRFIHLMERYDIPTEDIQATYTRALRDPILHTNAPELTKVAIALCSTLNRRYNSMKVSEEMSPTEALDRLKADIRTTFMNAQELIKSATTPDPYLQLEYFWQELESRSFEDVEQSRLVWKTITATQRSYSGAWIARIEFEKQRGTPSETRKLFRQALSNNLDWPEKVFDAWMAFEHLFGRVEDFEVAWEWIQARTTQLVAQRANEAKALEAESAEIKSGTGISQTYNGAMAESAEISAQDHSRGVKRKNSSTDSSGLNAKHQRSDDMIGSIEQLQGKGEAKAKAPGSGRLDISKGRHEDTCYVTNFPLEMDESTLKRLFKEYGTVLRCTLPKKKDDNERQRRFAYVQFSMPDEAQAALALNGRDVGGHRALQVQISDTTQKASRKVGQMAPAPAVSQRELFVSGIQTELNEVDLKRLFALQEADAIEVVISKKHDKPPIAVLRFASEEEAAKGLKLNGTMFHGKRLVVKRRVFHDAPSANKIPKAGDSLLLPSAKAESHIPTALKTAPSGSTPSKPAFAPRLTPRQASKPSRKLTAPQSASVAIASLPSTGDQEARQTTLEPSDEPVVPKKTNADFRAMMQRGEARGRPSV